ncbi:acyl-CoA synthetase [Phenylobacterium zucineum HLK1]|uniref:Acyl-CoA synthetase n=1 Tax=Phenylobacterium zucineum (strain HLK1) TaxID=450851 RepID=B4RH18_PHEZH|nr:feruloyl-CoA synthase [Phenylobacterium zucineum]ACG78966.1 acyl-CoA synthetase [Phenylobacterium zucineum HLK1]
MSPHKPKVRALPIRPAAVQVEHRIDGSVVLEQTTPPAPAARSIPHLFAERVVQCGNSTFVAKRERLAGGGWGEWRRLSYGEAARQVRALAQALLDQGLGPGRSVMILSGPSPEHAVLALASQWVSAPVTAVATAYSLLADDFAKLRHVFNLCRPAMILVEGPEYARALQALPLAGVTVVSLQPIPGVPTAAFSDLVATQPTAAVEDALARVTAETVARYVFTSGSTGAPKAVIHTQGTLCAQIAARNALLVDSSAEAGSTRLSWMPWNHIGGIIHLNYAIEDGGSYYIDEGRPLPGQFAETLRNLREVIPAEFNSVPILYGQLADALEEDADLRTRFFKTVRYFCYSSAALSEDIFERIQAMAMETLGERVAFCTKYGTTEVQAVTHSARPMERPGEIGVPYPGAKIKLVPYGDKLEMRVKGDMVSPGYLGGEEINREAFDEESYYRTGDAAAFADTADPGAGLVFDGRVTENFKLSTGTWVSVGALRVALIEALAPLVQDAVIAGHDRDYIAVLAWPKLDQAARLAGLPPGAPLSDTLATEPVRRFVAERLAAHNARSHGSSLKVARLMLLEEPPVGDEQAEKGYINQRGVLSRRAGLVADLYADPPGPKVIVVGAEQPAAAAAVG